MGKPSRKKSSRFAAHPNHRYLIQFRVQAVAWSPCQSPLHQPDAEKEELCWQVRTYQDAAQILELLRQGGDEERLEQLLWEEACRKQDRVGVRMHVQSQMCSFCLLQGLQMHTGEKQLILAMLTARLVAGAFLVVINRETEQVGIFSPFPVEITEREMLRVIRETPPFRIPVQETSAT
jgi:hypothetical protein